MTTKEDLEDQILQLKGEILEKETQLRKLERIYGKMKEGDMTPRSITSSINNEDNTTHNKGNCESNKLETLVSKSPIGISVAPNKSIITPLNEAFLSKGSPAQSTGNQTTQGISLSPQTKKTSKYYVLYSGPNQGIYTEWAKIAPLIGTNHHQSFYDHEEAQKALFTYKRAQSLNDQKTYSQAAQSYFQPPLKIRPNTPQTRNLDPRPSIPETIKNRLNRSRITLNEEVSSINKERFCHYFNMAEASDEDKEQCFFTMDRKNISLYAFYEKANPETIKEVFDCGLLATVYPSNNLNELRLLPKSVFNAIKNFRTKVIGSGERDIYVKITSSLLDWNEEGYFLPYHWIEVGLSKVDITFEQPQARKITENIEDLLQTLRASRLRSVYRKYTEIYSDSKKKLNYHDDKIVVISNFPNVITTQELEKIALNEAKFLDGELKVPEITKRQWCEIAPPDHKCIFCINKGQEGRKIRDDDSETTNSLFGEEM